MIFTSISGKNVWEFKRGSSFLNNKRLPYLSFTDKNLAEMKKEFTERASVESAFEYILPIIRQYQSLLECTDICDKDVHTGLLKGYRVLKSMLCEMHKRIQDEDEKIAHELQVNSMLGDVRSYVTYNLNNNEDAYRRKMSAIKKISSYLESQKKLDNPYVHSFFSDFGRIAFSSSFRRLQDKAQVFPLEKYDYARTRLTHTIEVTSIAMQLSNLTALKVCYDDNLNKKEMAFLLEKCINCAALLHDLGNPPYGHFGEDAIKDYFRGKWDELEVSVFTGKSKERAKLNINKLATNDLMETAMEQMKNDFICFDGNAQSLRVAAKLQHYKIGQPLNLTAAVLGSIIKYPCNSTEGYEHGKFGYFYSEGNIIEQLKKMGVYQDKLRNPISMLLEAADDICYVTSDLDDAVKKNALPYEVFIRELKKHVRTASCDEFSKKFYSDFVKYFKENHSKTTSAYEYTIHRMTNDLRNKLIRETVDVFCGQVDTILGGVYFQDKKGTRVLRPPVGSWIKNEHMKDCESEHCELLKGTPSAGLVDWIKKNLFRKYIYNDEGILKNELAGHRVISYLLDQFVNAVLSLDFTIIDGDFRLSGGDKCLLKQEKIFKLISPNFVEVFRDEVTRKDTFPYSKRPLSVNSFEHVYHRLKLVVDYISGMTDSYALETYKILQGM